MISFRRNRRHRDEFRRDCEGRRRYLLFTEFQLLGPRDLAILNLLRAEAADFDLAGRTPPALPPLDDGQALHYLRDPALRHWVAECGRRIFGYLVAHLHLGYAGPPTLVITALGIRPEHRSGHTWPRRSATRRSCSALVTSGRSLRSDDRRLPTRPRVPGSTGWLPATRGVTSRR
jgi:hypothetical protein